METRICKVCGETKPFARGSWVTKRGNPEGCVCLNCTSKTSSAKKMEKYNSDEEYRTRIIEQAKAANRNANPELKAMRNAASREYKRAKYGVDANYKYNLQQNALRWAKNNRWYMNAQSNFRRAAELRRTPAWLTQQDCQLTEAKYAMARWLGEVVGVAYHVDHVIPLQGKLVSGLHVPDNLCVLRGDLNASKGNKWVP